MKMMGLLGAGDPRPTITRAAWVSDCGTYRYWLSRRWGPGGALTYVMWNPSTADAEKDDQTIRRCMYFAKREGYDGVRVLNLYAYRTTFPKDLAEAARRGVDVVGPDNLRWVREITLCDEKVVLAWGGMTFKEMDRHGDTLRATFAAMPRDITYLCLGATANESPRHPSRLGNTVMFEEYLPSLELLPEDSVVYRKILGRGP